MGRSRRAPVRCTREQPQQRLRPLAPPPAPSPPFISPPPLPRDPHRGNTSGPDYFLDPLASAPSAATGEAPPGATISNADLIAQLQARQEAKARRDFATADAIRFALERQHRVKVYDTTKSWIANDGRKGNTVGPNFFSLDGTSFAAGNQAPPISGSPRRYVGFVGSRNESFGRNEHIVSDAPAAAPPSPPAATASGSAGQAVPVVLDEPVPKSVAPPPTPPPPPPPRRVAHADVSQSPRSKLGAVMAPIITKSLAPTDDVQQQLDAVKSTLYTYEVAFESQNGYKPRTRAEWGEVWAEYERYAALRKLAKDKEAQEEAAARKLAKDKEAQEEAAARKLAKDKEAKEEAARASAMEATATAAALAPATAATPATASAALAPAPSPAASTTAATATATTAATAAAAATATTAATATAAAAATVTTATKATKATATTTAEDETLVRSIARAFPKPPPKQPSHSASRPDSRGPSEGISEGISEGVSEKSTEGVSEKSTEGISEKSTEGVSERVSDGISMGSSEGITEASSSSRPEARAPSEASKRLGTAEPSVVAGPERSTERRDGLSVKSAVPVAHEEEPLQLPCHDRGPVLCHDKVARAAHGAVMGVAGSMTYAQLMAAGMAENQAGHPAAARILFLQCYELSGQPYAALSAANMSLKLGRAQVRGPLKPTEGH